MGLEVNFVAVNVGVVTVGGLVVVGVAVGVARVGVAVVVGVAVGVATVGVFVGGIGEGVIVGVGVSTRIYRWASLTQISGIDSAVISSKD